MFSAVLQNWIGLLSVTVTTAIACIPIELLARNERHSWMGRARSILFWAIMLSVYAAALVGAQTMIRHAGVKPLVTFDLTMLGVGMHWLPHLGLNITLALIPAFLFDLCYYWFHRMQHAVPLLWRWHSVHHAIEELNATNCHHHWSEGLLRVPMIVAPLMLLVELRVPEIFILSIMLAAWGQVVHVTNAIDFGVLRTVFVSPRFHRVHHSLDAAHFDRNFAGMFPVIDVVFRTAHFPKAHESIKTGLAGQRETQTLRDYLMAH
jgi:sterol desaturase/sphingolipid hydroxylase (fatty acid hydroxylase superfamily)